MAAKMIVTSHPDVACDLCGRRLLRGERPDVFLGGGQRRTVCELCAPRASHEGWRREVEDQLAPPRVQHPQRGRSLLGRLRQLREPVRAPQAREPLGASDRGVDASGPQLTGASETPRIEWAGIEREWSGADEDWGEAAGATGATGATVPDDPAGDIAVGDVTARPAELAYASGDPAPAPKGDGATLAAGDADAEVRRALEIFNAGELPRRVAGVTRSLGEACVHAMPIPGVAGGVAIVVAWELCWYRYEIDLADEAGAVRIAAEGMELEELAPHERVANAVADEHGTLSLLGG